MHNPGIHFIHISTRSHLKKYWPSHSAVHTDLLYIVSFNWHFDFCAHEIGGTRWQGESF